MPMLGNVKAYSILIPFSLYISLSAFDNQSQSIKYIVLVSSDDDAVTAAKEQIRYGLSAIPFDSPARSQIKAKYKTWAMVENEKFGSVSCFAPLMSITSMHLTDLPFPPLPLSSSLSLHFHAGLVPHIET